MRAKAKVQRSAARSLKATGLSGAGTPDPAAGTIDVTAAPPPCLLVAVASALRRSWTSLARWIDAVWGYDVFIAHRRADAAPYAAALRAGLKVEGIESFIDREFYVPGNSLLMATERHIARSTMLLLIGSPELLTARKPTDWVEKEIEAFLRRRPDGAATGDAEASPLKAANLLLIDFGGVVASAQPAPDLPGFFDRLAPFLRVDEPASALDAAPSVAVLAAIRANLGSRRRDISRLRLFQKLAAALLLLLTLAILGGVAALNYGVTATRAAAAADLSASLERAIEHPDEAALLAARALAATTRSWLLAPFLDRDRRRAREILGAVRLPTSDIRWLGGRPAAMQLSPDKRDLVLVTERGKLVDFDAAALTQRFSRDLPEADAFVTLSALDKQIMLFSDDPPHVLLLDRDGSVRLNRTFGAGEKVVPVAGAGMLVRRDRAGRLSLLDLVAGTERPIPSSEIGPLEQAEWLPGPSRLVVLGRAGAGVYEERIFDGFSLAPVGPVRLTAPLGLYPLRDAVGDRLYHITKEGHVEAVDLLSGRSLLDLSAAYGLTSHGVWPSPNGDWFAVTSGNGTDVVELRDSATHRLLLPPLPFSLHAAPAFSPSGEALALPGAREVVVIDRRKPDEISRLNVEGSAQTVMFLDEGTVAVATIEGRVAIFDVATRQPREQGVHHPGGHVLFAILADGRLASAGWDGTVRATEIPSSAPPWTREWTGDAIVGLDAHPTQDLIAIATFAGRGAICRVGATACSWDRDLGRKLLGVAFVDRGRMVLFSRQDLGGFSLLDAVTGAETASADAGLAVGDRKRPVIGHAQDGKPLVLRRVGPDPAPLCVSAKVLKAPSALAMSDDGKLVLAVTAGDTKRFHLLAFDAADCALRWTRRAVQFRELWGSGRFPRAEMCESIGDNPNQRLSNVRNVAGVSAVDSRSSARRGQAVRSGHRVALRHSRHGRRGQLISANA